MGCGAHRLWGLGLSSSHLPYGYSAPTAGISIHKNTRQEGGWPGAGRRVQVLYESLLIIIDLYLYYSYRQTTLPVTHWVRAPLDRKAKARDKTRSSALQKTGHQQGRHRRQAGGRATSERSALFLLLWHGLRGWLGRHQHWRQTHSQADVHLGRSSTQGKREEGNGCSLLSSTVVWWS